MNYFNTFISQLRKLHSQIKMEQLMMVLAVVLLLPFYINAQQFASNIGTIKTEQLSPTAIYSKPNAETTKVSYDFHNTRKINPYDVSGMKLEDVTGKFTIAIPSVESRLFYNVKMRSCEVIRKEEITLRNGS